MFKNKNITRVVVGNALAVFLYWGVILFFVFTNWITSVSPKQYLFIYLSSVPCSLFAVRFSFSLTGKSKIVALLISLVVLIFNFYWYKATSGVIGF